MACRSYWIVFVGAPEQESIAKISRPAKEAHFPRRRPVAFVIRKSRRGESGRCSFDDRSRVMLGRRRVKGSL